MDTGSERLESDGLTDRVVLVMRRGYSLIEKNAYSTTMTPLLKEAFDAFLRTTAKAQLKLLYTFGH